MSPVFHQPWVNFISFLTGTSFKTQLKTRVLRTSRPPFSLGKLRLPPRAPAHQLLPPHPPLCGRRPRRLLHMRAPPLSGRENHEGRGCVLMFTAPSWHKESGDHQRLLEKQMSFSSDGSCSSAGSLAPNSPASSHSCPVLCGAHRHTRVCITAHTSAYNTCLIIGKIEAYGT